jgi:hypothetical protein
MDFDERIVAIDRLSQEWLIKNNKDEARPVDLMDYLIKHGVYREDIKRGLPLRNDLRKLKERKELNRIRGLDAQLVNQNTNWYFRLVE